MKNPLKPASALLLVLLIPACAAGNGIPLPGTSKQIDELPRVQNSAKSPCWQQQQIAQQNSYVDTIRTKTEKVYKAPCDVDGTKVASAKR